MMNRVHARALLELDVTAGPDQARQHYRDLVRVWHPDRFEGDARLRAKAGQRLAQITEAYRLLEQEFARGTDSSDAESAAAGARPVAAVRVQTAAVMAPVRRSWLPHAAVAMVVLAVMALALVPRRDARTVRTATLVETPLASVPVAPPVPVTKPAVAQAIASRSFIARETDPILLQR